MKKNGISLKDVFKNIGSRKILAAILVMVFTVGVISAGGYFLYSSKKDAISESCELAAIRSAKEVDGYLSKNTNAISVAGYNADRMIKQGETHEAIFGYLFEETEHIRQTVDESSNGVYAVIEGEFRHCGGWIPPDDFVATERPWYIEVVENESDLTYVKPYLDAQTNTVMMTVASRLSDGKSITAMDISLGELQEFTEETAASVRGNVGMILADDGYVVAHSDISEREKEYSSEEGTLGNVIYSHLTGEDSSSFELNFSGSSYIVYVVRLECGWNTVSVINADVVFRPLRIIIASVIAIALISALAVFLILVSMSRKNIEARNLNVQLSSVADIYVSMHDINLFNNSYRAISKGHEGDESLGESGKDAQTALNSSMEILADEMSRESILHFVDLSTLNERLRDSSTVTEEFLNTKNLWCRARFIAAERTKGGNLRRVLWVVESIDAEKRRRDKLLYLSETDQMTGINNRSSGERKVSKLLDQGYGGMFVMLDADKFKSVNDTFGHDVGDKVIIAIANCLKKTFRVDDVVMRLGGDEFAAFAVGVFTEDIGRMIINRLFDNINQIKIPELGDRKIEISVGAAFYMDDDSYAFSELYKRADECAYLSKKTPGNFVTFRLV